MYVQSIARTAARLAMILLFILALAGCGDDADDTGARMEEHAHEHEDDDHEGDEREEVHLDEFPGRLMVMDSENHAVQVFDLESERVVGDPIAIGPSSTEPDFAGTLLRRTSNGRYGFVLQYTWPYAVPYPDENRVVVIDSGLTTFGHGDHIDPMWGRPRQMPYVLGHGGGVETGLYNPIHIVSHHGHTAIFYDGSRYPGDDSQNVNGVAVAYRYSDFDSETIPEPVFELDVGTFIHGAVVPFHDLFIVSTGMPSEEVGGLDYSATPTGVATYRANAKDAVEDIVQDFGGLCPGLHGEAVSGDYVAFGCTEGPASNENPNYTGPEITERSGILVLTYHEDHFDADVVAYPDDGTTLTSGSLRGGMGPSKGIFMATYGENFLKITASEVVNGTDAGSELFMVEADSGRHRDFAFEPVDHNFGGEGRFVVLTGTNNLHIFDLEHGTKKELAMPCSEDGCSSLALAPGFAYVTDTANNKVYEVHLEDAEIEDEFDLNAPTSLVVLGWFELEEELLFH